MCDNDASVASRSPAEIEKEIDALFGTPSCDYSALCALCDNSAAVIDQDPAALLDPCAFPDFDDAYPLMAW